MRIAAVPPAKQELTRVIKYQYRRLAEAGVTCVFGTELTAEDIQRDYAGYEVVLAYGAEPIAPAFMQGFKQVMTADDLLGGKAFPGKKIVIYLGGGLVGNLCSYLHELSLMKTGEAPAVSAGASGAIFSAVGAMLVLLAFRKGRLEDLTFRRMAVMAVLSLLVGFQSSNVDNFAHIGGFLAGAVLMAVLYPGMARIRKRGKRLCPCR